MPAAVAAMWGGTPVPRPAPWPALLFIPLLLTAQDLTAPRALYQKTEYEQALKAIGNRQDQPALQLAGQCYIGLEDYKKAIDVLEQAATDSESHMWLGRAYGRRAETAMPLLAPRYASKARQAFEKAVELDPKNILAMNDLFEYYLQAPGFLGGGKDKAEALSRRIAALNKAEGHYAQARLKEDRKDYIGAEPEYRAAIEADPKEAGRVLDLARFLARRNRIIESDAVFAKAEALAPNAPKVLYAKAETYIEQKRKLPEARQLLERYLKSDLTPDDASRKQARKLLEKAR